MNIDQRLAVYGTLAPGRANHHQLSALAGHWLSGTVKGRLVVGGWGSALGFPALVLADDGDTVEVQLFVSPDLPDHWARLDAFEGNEYRRAQARVETAAGAEAAWIYVLAEPAA